MHHLWSGTAAGAVTEIERGQALQGNRDADSAEARRVISISNSWDMWVSGVLKESRCAGMHVLAVCVCVCEMGVHVGDSCNVMEVPPEQRIH